MTPRAHNLYPITEFATLDSLEPCDKVFLSTLDVTPDPVFSHEAVAHPKWCVAMNSELRALD